MKRGAIIIEPFYFGDPEKQLFGVFHAPKTSSARETGILLLYPWGQEYIRSHRAYLMLAQDLAGHGYPTLRFDYYGSGDSAGSCGEGSLASWLEDVNTAARELTEGSGVEKIALYGLRLGGSLAALACSKIDCVAGALLWDSVVNGKEHIQELRAVHADWKQGSFARSKVRRQKVEEEEILGFRFNRPFRDHLIKLDLKNSTPSAAHRMLLLNTQDSRSLQSLYESWNSPASIEYCHRPAPPIWQKQGPGLGDATVPKPVLDEIVTWTEKTFR